MLSPQEVNQFWTHEDEDVRQFVYEYFANNINPHPATADDLWREWDATPPQERSANHFAIKSDIPWTSSALFRLLTELGKPQRRDIREEFLTALTIVDLPLFLEHRDTILAAMASSDLKKLVERRIRFAEQSAESLWDELVSVANASDARELSVDEKLMDQLSEALSMHPDFVAPRAMEILTAARERSWLELYCVQLVGLIRHRPAMNLVLDRLAFEEELFYDFATQAAPRIDGGEAISSIEARFAQASIAFRISAADALLHVKTPETEQACLRLLNSEKDHSVLAFIGRTLCRICTTAAAEAVRELIIRDRYDNEAVSLEEQLLIMAKLTGYVAPEFEEWQNGLGARAERLDAERLKKYPEWMSLIDRMQRALNDPRLDGSDGIDRSTITASISRDRNKVGRNDPCSCGSGKKYKKCCGR